MLTAIWEHRNFISTSCARSLHTSTYRIIYLHLHKGIISAVLSSPQSPWDLSYVLTLKRAAQTTGRKDYREAWEAKLPYRLRSLDPQITNGWEPVLELQQLCTCAVSSADAGDHHWKEASDRKEPLIWASVLILFNIASSAQANYFKKQVRYFCVLPSK